VTGECLDDGMDHAKAFRPIYVFSLCSAFVRLSFVTGAGVMVCG